MNNIKASEIILNHKHLVDKDTSGLLDKKLEYEAIDMAVDCLKNATKIGCWIKEETIYGWDNKSYQCSVCGRSIHLDTLVEDLDDYPYCHCGAKMVKG